MILEVGDVVVVSVGLLVVILEVGDVVVVSVSGVPVAGEQGAKGIA